MSACRTCMYFDERAKKTQFTMGDGFCRRDTPRIDAEGSTVWPSVKLDDWCGQYAEDPDSDPTYL